MLEPDGHNSVRHSSYRPQVVRPTPLFLSKVLVDPATKKTASAHDLRRAFGYRWSRLVKTTQLKELMRHASIETTLTYYVGENAESTAEELWAALGDKLGDKQVVIEKENSKTP